MSGHSHWSGIKHKKEITDQKRGKVFSKLLAAVTAAARTEPNPDFNPRLRTAVQKAKEANVPTDNIERAIKKAAETGGGLEELTIESYGPGGVAMLIEAVADNKNRVISEIKKILSNHGAKWAEQGSVRWAFSAEGGSRPEADAPREHASGGESRWTAKFTQELGKEDAEKLDELLGALGEHDDVQEVYTNAKI